MSEEKLNIILNGKITSGIKGETILECTQRHGIDIPTLCHDPRLDPYTSCYLCVVEVEGFRGLQPACSTKINDGMKIETHNEKIYKARKTALELLVSNHYADCVGPCKQTCPAGVDVQGYISYIEKGMYSEAVALIKETNPLPAVCGRVCVRPCEVACRRNMLDEGAAVGIDYLKRFASDKDLESENKFVPDIKASTGKKVAVIGAGPGGLSCGFFLQKEGHQVDIFEAAPKPGGWLRYGIPEYRLPNDILQKEVDNITDLGVNIFYNRHFGKDVNYEDLKKKYDAVILTIGSQKGTLLGCDGEDAENVFSGIDFLKKMELTGEKINFKGYKVAVVGGGNTAMDCCRTSMRLGADKVYVIYRRTEKEMPANPIEIHESKLEGVEYMLLTNPARVNKNEKGQVKSVTCLKMKLGEPDASGRRRPVPIEGSEFELEVDYILAAIGQKTEVDFLGDINSNGNGELKLNRWGDIDADPKTLQTGIESVFAAGDGVTGPATLIEAIGQAKIASRSAHQFLSGQPLVPEKKEFISKKDNFKEQATEDYKGIFEEQLREEMPTLDPGDRKNFKEVELGYSNEEVAYQETQRCLECGCSAFFTCDLKKHSTDYEAEQKHYEGAFNEYEVDFSHPYIEIDNNKCILCGRCIRICNEVVGANALGLVNRGYDAYVAPAMGDSLKDGTCESCGLCLSTCPTGALTENVDFKPGPVKMDMVETICNYCSIGCKISLHHKNGFVMQVRGEKGMVNNDGNLCRFPKFGYQYLNDKSRITKPLLKENDGFKEISFKKAYDIIVDKIKKVDPDENMFFAGARLTNEELYLVQKFARLAVNTNNVTSFHYLNRGDGYVRDAEYNVLFDQLKDASNIILLGSEINMDNAVAGFIVNKAQKKEAIPLELVTTNQDCQMKHKADSIIQLNSYYYFIKAINYYLVSNHFENELFINDQCEGFDEYKEKLLRENFDDLVEKAGVIYMEEIIEFAKRYNKAMNAVIVFSEKEVCSHTAYELYNLAMITGKLGKTANGLVSLKEKNNSQGIFDMGVCPSLGVGAVSIEDKRIQSAMKSVWQDHKLTKFSSLEQYNLLGKGEGKNLFVFGEDPLGCAMNRAQVESWLSMPDFVVVQDYFLTETAEKADIILPASFPIETGGSFTNTQKVIQEFDAVMKSRVERASFQQLLDLLARFNSNGPESVKDVLMEAISMLPKEEEKKAHHFVYTKKITSCKLFNFGCDSLVKRFEQEFEEAFRD